MKQRKSNHIRKRGGAIFLAICMVLPFLSPIFSNLSLAQSTGRFFPSNESMLANLGESQTSIMAEQNTGTSFSVKDQYGRPVNNIYFVITNISTGQTYFGRASDGVLYFHDSTSYSISSIEQVGFQEGQYHDVKVYDKQGDAENYTLDPNALLARFYLNNGQVYFDTGSSTNLVLQSKLPPSPTSSTQITARDKHNNSAEGIAFRLYKEGETNIQEYLVSDAEGKLVYSANKALFDAKDLDPGTYTLKVTPQSSTDQAKVTYSMDATQVYSTISVTEDGEGNKEVVFSPAGSQTLIFPLIADLPKGEADLTVEKTGENGDPLSGVTFQLQGPVDSDTPGHWTSTPTNADGETVFSKLAYGEYLLTEISAPEGYVVNKQVIHVMLGKDSDVPYVGGKDVTSRLSLQSVTWNSPHVEGGVNTIYPNQAESLSVDAVIQVPTSGEPIVPGDFFTVQLSENVDTYGLVRSEDQGLDIFANGGKLAEGKFDPNTRTITYTFTNLVKSFTSNQIKLHTVLFIDKVQVPEEVKDPPYLTISYGLAGRTSSESDFRVLYRPYYYPQVTGGSNIGTMYSIYNPDKKTATTYIYVNPLTNPLKKSKLEISGKGSVLVNALTDVTVYEGGTNADAMVPSWGLIPDNLTKVEDLDPVIDGNANKITIDLEDKLASGTQSYIVKVTTGYDPASKDDLGMVAKLYGYYNGYWSRYYGYQYYDYDWSAAQTYMKFYEHEGTATGVTFTASVKVSNAKNRIEWTKVNASGLPLEGAEFTLVRVTEEGEVVVLNDLRSLRDGRLSASGLGPGDYRLYETKAPEGYEVPKDQEGKPMPIASFSVDEDGVIQNPQPEDGKLVNGRNEGRFSIHKTDNAEEEADQLPLEGVEFTLTPLMENDEEWIPDPSKPVIKKTTDAEGNLTFAGLAIGKYQLKESKPAGGYLLGEKTWTVEVKEETLASTQVKRIVTVVTEDASPLSAPVQGMNKGGWVESSTGDRALEKEAGQALSLLPETKALLLNAPAEPGRQGSSPILRAAGNGKYQYKNPLEIDGTTWPENVQEVDVDGDKKADYKISQTMVPDGTIPGQYKVDVKVEKMPGTMELVILMDNSSAFSQLSGNKIDRLQWGGVDGGALEAVPTAYQWLDYYFGGNRSGQGAQKGRITDLLKEVQKTYPDAKVTLIGAGGAKSSVNYWMTNPYTSLPINEAIAKNGQLNASGVYNPNAPEPRWDFIGGWGRKGLKAAMQLSYDTLKNSSAQKKVFFHLQGMPTLKADIFTKPYLVWWDSEETDDARRNFGRIQKIAQVNWLVELDPSEYDSDFIKPREYASYGLPDPGSVHFLQNAKEYWKDKDQYWYQADHQPMETAYNTAMADIAKNMTTGSAGDETLDFRIKLADNVLWREPSDSTMTDAGVTFDSATGSLTKSSFSLNADQPLTFSYYVKANAQAAGAKLNTFENINQPATSGLRVNRTAGDGTLTSMTSPLPIPQLRIPGWETQVIKHWYGNSAEDNARFQTFPESGSNPPMEPANPIGLGQRKESQVLIYSDQFYADDPETRIAMAQRMKTPYENMAFVELLPYYDNNGAVIHYQATEYHDPLFHTKTNLIQDENTLKQTFYIGAQLDPVIVTTDIEVTKEWGPGTKAEDQVPVQVYLEAFRVNGDGSRTALSSEDLQALLEGKASELTLDGSTGWKGTFKDLPTSQILDGQASEIVYRVKEEALPGYDVSYLYDYREQEEDDGSIRPTHYYTIINQKHELLKVANEPNRVDFYKVNGSGKPLAGARFTLQRKNGDEWIDVEGYVDFTSREVGEGESKSQEIHLEKLEPGDYQLNEITSPSGFKEPTNPVASFSVSPETGKIEEVKAMGVAGTLLSGHTIANIPEVEIYVLPSTAGPGTLLFTFMGTMLIALALSLRETSPIRSFHTGRKNGRNNG